ncbi:hypothetical protein XENORESO_006369 [Xenotaenia resolanae]|uniref:Uncharacterized protein n=1 Tax=Xenotaenia resolanae TaxID=208358 RepID=A0ABV0WPN3_9TELE
MRLLVFVAQKQNPTHFLTSFTSYWFLSLWRRCFLHVKQKWLRAASLGSYTQHASFIELAWWQQHRWLEYVPFHSCTNEKSISSGSALILCCSSAPLHVMHGKITA